MKKLKFLMIFLMVLAFTVPSFAADSTITNLTDLSAIPDSDDEFVMWDSSTVTTKKVSYSNLADIRVDIAKNVLINGGMAIAQRGASGSASFTDGTNTVNSDDTVIFDRWWIFSDGNNIVDISQQSGGGTSGNEIFARLDIETAQKKFAWCQIVENANTKSIVGSTASVSAEIQVSNATRLSDIRMVVLSWSSTADSVVSDWVSAWGAEGVVPTPAANWAAENTAANLGVTTSWVKYKIENISIDTASAANVAACIYQNNVATASDTGDFLEITNFQLEPGTVSTNFEYRLDELSLCERRYWKTYDSNVVLGTADTDGIVNLDISALANADHSIKTVVRFPVMGATPTVTSYDAAGTSGKVTMAAGNNIAATVDAVGFGSARVSGTNGAASTARKIQYHLTVENEL